MEAAYPGGSGDTAVVSGDAITAAFFEGVNAFIPRNKVGNPYVHNPMLSQAWEDGYNEGAANYLYNRFAPKHNETINENELVE